MSSGKLCLVYNTAPHYREAVFTALDKEYDCDWFFGETKTDIKEMDISKLQNVQYYKTTWFAGNRLYWQKGLISKLFDKNYQNFLVLSEVRSVSLWLFMGLKRLFFSNKRVYGWSHGLYGREGKFRKLLERWKANGMECLFVYNNRARNLFIENGTPSSKVITIYNSLDYSAQLSIRESLKETSVYRDYFNNSNPTIIFIGRLTKSKKLDWLLSALEILSQNRKSVNAVFVGGGEAMDELKSIAEKKKIPAWFYGPCYDEVKNGELLFNADLCVSPGNVGLTAIHSLMFGTPVITNDDLTHQGPEFEAIKEGVTGTFFRNGSIHSLASSIANWFESHPSRATVRANCYREVDKNWNPQNQMRIFRKYLQLK